MYNYKDFLKLTQDELAELFNIKIEYDDYENN